MNPDVVIPPEAESGFRLAPPNTTLICSEGGSAGRKVGYIENEVHFGNKLFAVTAGPRLDSKFLHYFHLTDNFTSQFRKRLTGLIGGVSLKNFQSIEVPIPPLEEQKRIVARLDQAFTALDRARVQIQANLADAGELFPSVLSKSFQPDEPWSIHSVADLVSCGILERPIDGNHGGAHPKKADFVDVGVPFIMASDLVEGAVDQESCYFITREQADSLRKGFAKDGDVLLSHKGTIGRAAILETSLDYVMLTPQVTHYRIRDSAKLDRSFLYFCMRSSAFQKKMIDTAGAGATRAYIGITRQLELTMPLPNLETQQKLVQQFQDVEAKARSLISEYTKRISEVNDFRQSLLQRAFSGRLT